MYPILLTQKREGWKYLEPPSNPKGLLEGGKPWLGKPKGLGVGKEEGKVSCPGSAAEGILEGGAVRAGGNRWTGVAWKHFFQSPKGAKSQWTSELRAPSIKQDIP